MSFQLVGCNYISTRQAYALNQTNTAIPRLLTVDDEYKGYRLPAGSVVIPNAWYVIL